MAGKKGKKGNKGKGAKNAEDVYDSFSAPVSLLQARFRQKATQAGVSPPAMAPVLEMFDKVLDEGNDVKTLKQIVIGQPIGEECAMQLCKTFQELYYTKLRSICFWNADIGDLACSTVCCSIPLFEHLHKLDLRDCGFGPLACKALANSLRRYRNPHLRILALDHNNFGDEGPEFLKQTLKFQKRLQTLSMNFCGLQDMSGRHLAEVLMSPMCRLTTLEIEGNELGGDGVSYLSQGLQINKSLTTLKLANNRFGGEDDLHAVASIAKAIQENSNLRSVDLDGNLIGEDGAVLLLQTLSASAHLLSLVVTHQISKATFQSITEALYKNNKDLKKGKGGKKGKGKKNKN